MAKEKPQEESLPEYLKRREAEREEIEKAIEEAVKHKVPPEKQEKLELQK